MRISDRIRGADRPSVARAGLVLTMVALIGGFAVAGPVGMIGLAAVIVALAGGVLLLPRPPLHVVWPACALLLLLPQIGPAVYIFDAVVMFALVATILWTMSQTDERVWEIGPAGFLALATLLVPLLAVPAVVVSLKSFFGQYKLYVAFVVMFFALRRLVRREESQVLLWIGPIVGSWAAIQLLVKTAGTGAVSLQNLALRNLHFNLGWGQSNYIAAVLVLCLFISALLLVLEKRLWARVVIGLTCLLMMRGFVLLYSRTATIALILFFLIVIVGRGGRAAVMAGSAAVLTALVFAATPYGAVLLSRFTDPTEFASAQVRLDIWRSAVERFVHHPWTGVGLNQGRYQMDIMSIDHAHNTFLDYISEQGIFGALVYFALLFAIFRLALRVRVPGAKADPRTIQVVCFAIVTAIVINSMAEPTWNAYIYSMVMVYFIVWMMHQGPEAKRPPDPGASEPPGR